MERCGFVVTRQGEEGLADDNASTVTVAEEKGINYRDQRTLRWRGGGTYKQ